MVEEMKTATLAKFPSVAAFGIRLYELHGDLMRILPRNSVPVMLLYDQFFDNLGPRYVTWRRGYLARNYVPPSGLRTANQFKDALVDAMLQELAFQREDAAATRQGMLQSVLLTHWLIGSPAQDPGSDSEDAGVAPQSIACYGTAQGMANTDVRSTLIIRIGRRLRRFQQ